MQEEYYLEHILCECSDALTLKTHAEEMDDEEH
jgi:hypothetical protein